MRLPPLDRCRDIFPRSQREVGLSSHAAYHYTSSPTYSACLPSSFHSFIPFVPSRPHIFFEAFLRAHSANPPSCPTTPHLRGRQCSLPLTRDPGTIDPSSHSSTRHPNTQIHFATIYSETPAHTLYFNPQHKTHITGVPDHTTRSMPAPGECLQPRMEQHQS